MSVLGFPRARAPDSHSFVLRRPVSSLRAQGNAVVPIGGRGIGGHKNESEIGSDTYDDRRTAINFRYVHEDVTDRRPSAYGVRVIDANTCERFLNETTSRGVYYMSYVITSPASDRFLFGRFRVRVRSSRNAPIFRANKPKSTRRLSSTYVLSSNFFVRPCNKLDFRNVCADVQCRRRKRVGRDRSTNACY